LTKGHGLVEKTSTETMRKKRRDARKTKPKRKEFLNKRVESPLGKQRKGGGERGSREKNQQGDEIFDTKSEKLGRGKGVRKPVVKRWTKVHRQSLRQCGGNAGGKNSMHVKDRLLTVTNKGSGKGVRFPGREKREQKGETCDKSKKSAGTVQIPFQWSVEESSRKTKKTPASGVKRKRKRKRERNRYKKEEGGARRLRKG